MRHRDVTTITVTAIRLLRSDQSDRIRLVCRKKRTRFGSVVRYNRHCLLPLRRRDDDIKRMSPMGWRRDL